MKTYYKKKIVKGQCFYEHISGALFGPGNRFWRDMKVQIRNGMAILLDEEDDWPEPRPEAVPQENPHNALRRRLGLAEVDLEEGDDPELAAPTAAEIQAAEVLAAGIQAGLKKKDLDNLRDDLKEVQEFYKVQRRLRREKGGV